MLRLLRLRDFALVDTLELDLKDGLCLMTGETGAGKSILVEAVGLLAGDRADTEMVRSGSNEAVVEGIFDPKSTAARVRVLLSGWQVTPTAEVVVRRRIQRGGRSTATVNGCVVSLNQLRELGDLLVRIHGQNQSQSLLDEETHRRMLDAHPEVSPAAEETARTHAFLADALRELRDLQRSRAERAQRLDTVAFQRAEIDRVSPIDGEEEDLLLTRSRLQNVERIVSAASSLSQLLREGEASVALQLGEAAKHLGDLSEVDRAWEPYLRDLKTSAEVLATIASEAETAASDTQFDPEVLEKTLARLADLDALKRKYGPSLEEVLVHRETLEQEYQRLSGGAADPATAQRRVDEAFSSYRKAAERLSDARSEQASTLARAVLAELRPLAMEKARFEVDVVPRPATDPAQARPEGLEDVRFLFSANPGEPPKPLAKIASGGELSRTLLALLTSVHGAEGPHALIFDEVDAGIGGRPAERVGRRLRDLAANHQVLCITHLPQIAAFAHHHVRIEKQIAGRRTVVAARVLAEKERATELARMLAGETVTETAKRHAQELLRQARETLPLG